MRTLIFVMLMGLAGAVQADWTGEDTTRELLYDMVLVLDAATTSDIRRHPDLKESAYVTSRVIGKNPNDTDIILWFSALAYGHYVVSDMLGPSKRKTWQNVTFGYHLAVVANNLSLGLRVRF